MGHFATRLLFNQDHPLPFSTAKPPDWNDPHFGKSTTRSNQHPAAFALYQNVEHSPENILAKANKHVKLHYPEANIFTMAHYAKASLAHTIVSSLAIHANNQIAANRAHTTVQRSRTTQLANLARTNFAPVTPLYSPRPVADFLSPGPDAPLLCSLTA